jgi:hypothetical protein
MSLHMPITKRKISHHFQYAIWMYLVLAALALFGWNLIYTTTRYRPPENKQVEFYVQSSVGSEALLNGLVDRIHDEVMPEMELVTATVITVTDDYYGDMQLTVWISAAQGDVYLLSQEYFERFAASGAFMDLQPLVDGGQLDTGGLSLSGGYEKDTETGVSSLYGIPADGLTGFADYLVDTQDKYLCILHNNGNDKYSIMFLNYLLENLR